jgi:hypothetical protein
MAYDEWEEKSKERQREVEDEQNTDAMELYKDLATDTNNTPPNNNPFRKEVDDDEDDFNFISSSLAPQFETTVVSLLP